MPGVGRSGCVAEARTIRLNVEPEKLYRACMRARGWERVQVGVPDHNQFRGPEDAADFDHPPPPTVGQGTTHNDATTEIACRQPQAARPPGVVCSPR